VWEGEVAGGWGDVRRVAGESFRMVEDVSLARKSCLSPSIQSFSKIYYIFLNFCRSSTGAANYSIQGNIIM
jgi:hypothetical protein